MRLISRLFSTQHTAIAATRKRPLLGGAALLIAYWAGAFLRTVLLARVRWSATIIDHRVVVVTMALALDVWVEGRVVGKKEEK